MDNDSIKDEKNMDSNKGNITKKPIYKKWWFWVIILLLIIIIGGSNSNTSNNTNTDVNATQENVANEKRGENINNVNTIENETKEETKKTDQQIEKEFKDACKKYTFKEVARNPDKYKGKKMKFTGEVIQVSEGWYNSVDIRLNVTKNEYGWYEDTIYGTYTYKEGEGKILEDDIVTIYGTCDGDYTYTSIMGASVTLPKIDIEYITIK